MAKRIPVPADASRVRLMLSADELKAVEDMAHLCRLSVASFVRVAMIETARHPERVEAWQTVAKELNDAADEAELPKPGRPRVKDVNPPAKKRTPRK